MSMHGQTGKFIKKPEMKRPFGTTCYTLGDNTEIDVNEIGSKETEWIHLAQNSIQWQALVSTD
jgi:hypothetical protein